MRTTLTVLFALAASPALAASEYGFFSLQNTDFIVLCSFIVFIGVLIYFKVPATVNKLLDDRAAGIQSDLDEAKALREEAQSLLASYERKQKDVQEQAERIVSQAKAEAERSAEQAKDDIQRSVARRLETAKDQLESAKAAAIKDVRDRSVAVAVAAAREVVAGQMSAQKANALVDDAIAEVDAKLH